MLMMCSLQFLWSLKIKHKIRSRKRNQRWRLINRGLDQVLRKCQIPRGLDHVLDYFKEKELEQVEDDRYEIDLDP